MFPEKPGTTGKIKKYDVLSGKTVWEIPDPYPNWGGTMVTDGGLMFYGSLGGDFRAVDRKTGKILWSRKLGSGIIGNPITYKVGGRQYVAVYSGIGGWIGLPVTAGLDLSDKFGGLAATAMTKAAGLNFIPQGGELNVFGGARLTEYSLLEEVGTEEHKYGMYSYALLTNNSTESKEFLDEIFGQSYSSGTGDVTTQINMLYIPIHTHQATTANNKRSVIHASQILGAEFSDGFYDYRTSAIILLHLCTDPPQEVERSCKQPRNRGPYILTYPVPASALNSMSSPLLFVDLPDVSPRAYPEFIAAYMSVVMQQDASDDSKIKSMRLKLLNAYEKFVDSFPGVTKAFADIVHMSTKDAK
jgi:hypothetical protein